MFPVKFNKCPVCGSEKRIVEEEVKNEIEAGRLPKNSRVPAVISQSMLFDATLTTTILAKKQVPLLMGLYDICSDCGTLYLVEMQKQVALIDPQAKPRGGNGGQHWKTQ